MPNFMEVRQIVSRCY